METIWVKVYVNEMMANEFIAFLEFLRINKMKYTSYHGYEEAGYGIEEEPTIINIEVTGKMTESFNKNLSQYLYYQPIVQLDEEPDISDIDLIEEMSNID